MIIFESKVVDPWDNNIILRLYASGEVDMEIDRSVATCHLGESELLELATICVQMARLKKMRDEWPSLVHELEERAKNVKRKSK